jgi:WD40 repeat protein
MLSFLLIAESKQVWAVAFDPKGTLLASVSDDKSIIVYNVAH